MKLTCAKHGIELTNGGRCEGCVKASRDAYAALERSGLRITHSGVTPPPRVIADGVERDYAHEGTYLEYGIPHALRDELNEYIERRVAEYERTCECAMCYERRSVG
jgi:hypothetical protein